MSQASRNAILSIFILIMTFSLMQISHATELKLTITANERYNTGENIMISGNLTLDGSLVPDGLVTIQINDPKGNDPEENLFIMRTLTTGTTPSGPWSVEILEVIPCDGAGNPKDSFPRGGYACFNVTVVNNDASPHFALVTITAYLPNEIPFTTRLIINQTLQLHQQISQTICVPIPDNAPTGTAHVHATALTKQPLNNGAAWCPEKSATFSITSSGGGGSSMTTNTNQETVPTSATPGNFNTNFKISAFGGILGNYTIYATSWYNTGFASEQKTFEAILLADVNRDGMVDMADLDIVLMAFGSEPGDPDWNKLADLDGDGVVDMADVDITLSEFGKWGQY